MTGMRHIVLWAALMAVSVPLCLAQQRLTLEKCRQMAAEGSADLRNAELDVVAAGLQKQEALAEYFPSVSAMGLAFHALNPMLHITMTDVLGRSDNSLYLQQRLREAAAPYEVKTQWDALHYGYSGALTLTQPVFAGGRIVNGNALAALGQRAAGVKASLQRRTTLQQVDKDYYLILSLQEKQATLEGLQALLDTVQRNVAGAVAAGVAVKTDLSAVQIRRSELKAGMNKLATGLKLAKMNLLNSIGVRYNPYPTLPSDLPSLDSFEFTGSLDFLPSPKDVYVDEGQLAASLDETRLLDMQVEAGVLKKRMIVGESLPSLAFGASYGFSKLLDSPRWNGAMYAVLQIPITHWGKNSRKIQRQDIEIQKARNQREYLGQQLVLQMRQLYMELTCAWDQIAIAREGEALAAERLAQVREGYTAGVNTVMDLMQSESALRDATQARIDACLDYMTALEAYRLRSGSGK